jgi:hypothetical protein
VSVRSRDVKCSKNMCCDSPRLEWGKGRRQGASQPLQGVNGIIRQFRTKYFQELIVVLSSGMPHFMTQFVEGKKEEKRLTRCRASISLSLALRHSNVVQRLKETSH